MRALVAMDSFKGSMSSLQAGNAVARGIKSVYETAEVKISSLADGGEGTANALVLALNGEWVEVECTNPVGRCIKTSYGLIEKPYAAGSNKTEKIAVIEMAAAAGITLIDEDERNPLCTTTYGVGEIIADAVNKGIRKFIIGIGGSATNDGGAGMLQALGYSLLDNEGKPIKRGAIGLADLSLINTENVIPELKECSFLVACDVNNPLCGENGCSAIFGPQKGAGADMVLRMDKALKHYAEVAEEFFLKKCSDASGAGAAGGLGFAFLTFLDARLQSGAKIIFDETGLLEKIKNADIVITGEGKIDAQTVMGKGPAKVAALAREHGKKTIAFGGIIGEGAEKCKEIGIDEYYCITPKGMSISEAMKEEQAQINLEKKVKEVFNIIEECK